jgi:site-specific recombinase XerD
MRYKIICRTDVTNKQGKSPIYLQFSHEGRRKKVSTGISINAKFWSDATQQISSDYPDHTELQYQIEQQIKGYEKKLRRLEALDEPVNFDSLFTTKSIIRQDSVDAFFKQQISKIEQQGRISSVIKYSATYKSLHKFHPKILQFGNISVSFLSDFEAFLYDMGNKPNSIATKFSVLRAIYNKAIANKVFVCKENPFEGYKLGKHWEQTRKRAIRKEDVIRLMQAPLPNTRSPYTELSRDVFLFSYLSAGINFKDISTLRYSNIANGRIYYRRHKTGKEMNCRLTPITEAIIAKYKREKSEEDDYIFPILDRNNHKSEQQIYNRLHKVLAHINRELKGWSKRLGISPPLTTYVARHTYATVLKREGVNVALISESLGHSNIQTTQIYLDSFENSQIDEAMKHLL